LNLLTVLPFILLLIPFVPAIIELFRRKDKGPREIPEQTLYEEKPEIGAAEAEGEVTRVMGDFSLPEGTVIEKNLVVQGNLTLGRGCRVKGSVKAFGNVEVGEGSIIEGNILSEGKIRIGRESVVKGCVDSPQEIMVEEDASVGAISTDNSVILKPGAKVNRRILSGTYIIISSKKEAPQKPSEKSYAPMVMKPSEKEGLEALSPDEAKVLELVQICRSLEEICLKMTKDPSEVEAIIGSLIKKGYLDKDLKLKKPEAKVSTEALEGVTSQPVWKEPVVSTKEIPKS